MMKSNFEELLYRVRLGNDGCMEAWLKGCRSDDTELERQLNRIERSWPKLHRLCLELEATGFTGCLYDDIPCRSNEEWFCFVCPSKTPYWREAREKQLTLTEV